MFGQMNNNFVFISQFSKLHIYILLTTIKYPVVYYQHIRNCVYHNMEYSLSSLILLNIFNQLLFAMKTDCVLGGRK
jgi:hypothetical protein